MASSERGNPLFDGGPSWQPVQKTTTVTTTAATDITAAVPPNGGKWILDDLVVSADADTVVTIQDTDGIVLVKFDLPGGGPPVQLTPRDGFRLATIGRKLQAVSGSAVNLRVFTSVHEEAA